MPLHSFSALYSPLDSSRVCNTSSPTILGGGGQDDQVTGQEVHRSGFPFGLRGIHISLVSFTCVRPPLLPFLCVFGLLKADGCGIFFHDNKQHPLLYASGAPEFQAERYVEHIHVCHGLWPHNSSSAYKQQSHQDNIRLDSRILCNNITPLLRSQEGEEVPPRPSLAFPLPLCSPIPFQYSSQALSVTAQHMWTGSSFHF